MKKQLIFIIGAIILASCNSLGVNTQPPPATQSPSTTESSTQAPSSVTETTWKTYTNQVGFSIQYPSNWQEQDLPDEAGGNMHNIVFTGPEGGVQLKWGTGFGGACPDGYQPIAVAKGTLPSCHTKREDGTDVWSLSGEPLANTGFGGFVYTNDTKPESQAVVLQVLSTLSFP